MVYCAACGSQIPEGLRFCGNCGKAAPLPEDTQNLKTCPHCKSKIPKDATACRSCGKEVSGLALFGHGLQACGCILTLLITVPLALLFLFGYFSAK